MQRPRPGLCRAPSSPARPRPAPHPRCRPAPPPSAQRRAAQAFIETRFWARLPRWGPTPPGQSEPQTCRLHLLIPMATRSPAVNLLRGNSCGKRWGRAAGKRSGQGPLVAAAWDCTAEGVRPSGRSGGSRISKPESTGELRTPSSRGLPRCLGSIRWPSWLCPAPDPSGLESPERGPLAILTPVTPSCPGAPAIFILWLGWVQEFSQQSCWHLGLRDARWNRRPLSGVVGGMGQTPVATMGLAEQVLETTCLEGPLNAWG